MRELNVDFMNLYISVDNFIRDAYDSPEGVSEYIRQMEKKEAAGRLKVAAWDRDYKALKHLRWIRNQLTHEVGYDSDICKKTDYDRLRSFEDRLLSCSDPLAELRKAEGTARRVNKKKSLWQRIKSFLFEQ